MNNSSAMSLPSPAYQGATDLSMIDQVQNSYRSAAYPDHTNYPQPNLYQTAASATSTLQGHDDDKSINEVTFARRDMVDDQSPEIYLKPHEQGFDEDFDIIDKAEIMYGSPNE